MVKQTEGPQILQTQITQYFFRYLLQDSTTLHGVYS